VNIEIITVFIYSYILGSVPFGLILTKLFLKKDIRKIGSGNIGATNVLRTGGKFLAIVTLFFDVIKGYLSVYITNEYFNDLIFLSALMCFIGHIFPVWLKFKGGKGVATYLGIVIAISLKLAILFGIIWMFTLLIFRYSSFSSIFSTLVVFLYSLFLNNFSLNIFLFVIVIIVIFTHRENIWRLKNRTENKINF
jgi:acyl phosphate:glycerol-3-phosphate acyltransferase